MEGRIAEFIEDGRMYLAFCLQEKAGKLHLLTLRNKELNLSPKRVLLWFEKRYPATLKREEQILILRNVEERIEELKRQVNVAELWEIVMEEEALEFKDLGELVFGKGARDEQISAVVRALFDDKVYFKLKENRFYPNPKERVEEYFRKKEEEERRRQRIEQNIQWLKTALSQGIESIEENQDVINLLKGLALYNREAPEFETIAQIMREFGGPEPKIAYEILLRLGVWTPDEDLALIRSQFPIEFPSRLHLPVIGIVNRKISLEGRVDLRDLRVFTIDGPKTKDFDDALSLEKKKDGFRLGIHITDITPFIKPGSELDNFLMERGSSLYLPTRYIPMMPPSLSEETLSLKEGKDRCAITLFVEMAHNFKITSHQFVASVIRVSDQLTYDQVDSNLEIEERLEILHQIANALIRERMDKGALDLTLPELIISVRYDGKVELSLLDLSTPSRRLVAETMILYNHLCARFLRDQNIPALFRVQEGPTERLDSTGHDKVFYVFQQRRRLMPLSLSTTPGPHAPLGVDAYVQVTSPVRRYLDMVVQRQVSAAITGLGQWYSAKDLDEIKAQLDLVMKEQEKIKKASLNFWTIQYLKQNPDKVFTGIVLDDMRSRYRIIIKEVLMVVEAKKDDLLGSHMPGEVIRLKITKADPWTSQVEVKEVG